MRLPASRVLCTIGTPCTMSAVGSTETHRALATANASAIGFAAFDAGLVDVSPDSLASSEPRFVHRTGPERGAPVSLDQIESAWGDQLRRSMGIRALSRDRLAAHIPTDLAAP